MRQPAPKNLLILLLIPLLASCGMFGHEEQHAKKMKPGKPAKVEYRAEDFIHHLSLANLEVSSEQPDMGAVTMDLDVMRGYYDSLPKRSTEKTAVSVVALECKTKLKGKRLHLLAPFNPQEEMHPALEEIGAKVNTKACQLSNIWTATVYTTRSQILRFTGITPQESRPLIQQQMGMIYKTAEKPVPLVDAQIQLQLIRVFIDTRQRDAAYLAVENAKQLLVTAEKDPDNKETVEGLIKALEQLEGEVRQNLPFTL